MARSVPFRGVRTLAAAGLALVTALAVAVVGGSLPDAAAAPPVDLVSVHGFLTSASTADPNLLVVNYTVTVQGAALTGATLTATTFASEPVDPSTVQVDGATATVTQQTPSVMEIHLGDLGDGAYLVSYQQQRPPGSNVVTSATLDFTRNGTTASVRSGQLSLSLPDLSLGIPAGSGEHRAAELGTGRVAVFAANLRNRGAGTAAATLTITFPHGLRLDAVDGVVRLRLDSHGNGDEVGVHCGHQTGATVTCALGSVAHGTGDIVLVPVVAVRSASPGSYGRFRLSVAPTDDTDQNLADNAVSGRVKYTGIARLHVKLLANHRTAAVGSTITVRLRITNAGPQPASLSFGIVLAGSKHFSIEKFSTHRHPKHQRAVEHLPAPPRLGDVIEWNAGTLGAHHTAYARMVLKAKSAGRTKVQFYAASQAADPACDNQASGCHAITTLKLRAVPLASTRAALRDRS